MQKQPEYRRHTKKIENYNITAAQYAVCTVFLPSTEQAETYVKNFVLIFHITYIFDPAFDWKTHMFFEETVIFKL